ncbi:uncharacterized protein JN550_013493 [Neoarthrinium moseri]|uniref:uncharacterized protein n=1 Tax=Neoarthrinium moseri TaxID=1658444 RepID=UPI001FDCFA25|nr:uncharacterized protein JN550_013493 [Neoarthrinium moseri]KAI1857000.1 hypothetical protein JN550_013493 [Neoarthrinium moseri]
MAIYTIALAALVSQWLLCTSAAPAGSTESNDDATDSGVGILDIFIPPVRSDDLYYNVNVTVNSQVIPVLLDTGSGDLFVASDECPTNDPADGCYQLQGAYEIKPSDNIIPNETFFTIVGEGAVYGNQSLASVNLGGVSIPDLATGLVYSSAAKEFQNGSFAGILGLNMASVSRQVYFNGRDPPFDALAKSSSIAQPKFSVTLPRMGDPESPKVGRLTIGGIGTELAEDDIKYGPVFATPNYNYEDFPLQFQGWTIHLEGIRMNGKEVQMNNGSLIPTGEYLSMLDTGGSSMYFRPPELDQIASLFNGPTIYQQGHAIYFDCSIPQLLELKYFGQWYPVDPLDLLIPKDHGNSNGTELCHAALGSWTRTFGDSIIGVPFLRSAQSVFDYVTLDLKSQPRVGLVGTVDAEAAMKRYPDIYQDRIL